MRSTLFLLPSDEVSIFVRGSSRRSTYGLEWAFSRVSSKQELDRLLDAMLEILSEPQTRNGIAEELKSRGYELKLKAGGGWGNKRTVHFVEIGGTSLSVGFLLRVMNGRNVICSGPSVGVEATYVRADKWLTDFRDASINEAESSLLRKYLHSFGPASVTDFAQWLGVYVRDAKKIWEREAREITEVEVDGLRGGVLESDIEELEKAKIEADVVNLLPNFDSFLMGHKSHHNVVDEANHKRVYRGQGWVSPVLFVNGRSMGVWSSIQVKGNLQIRVEAFSKLSSAVKSRIDEEASGLGQFLGYETVKTVMV